MPRRALILLQFQRQGRACGFSKLVRRFDGSYCLFAAPVTGTRQGKTVLVELRDGADSETGERYTVKRYESEKVGAEDGSWRHVKITLSPFDPIELTSDDEADLAVVAELVEVLG